MLNDSGKLAPIKVALKAEAVTPIYVTWSFEDYSQDVAYGPGSCSFSFASVL